LFFELPTLCIIIVTMVALSWPLVVALRGCQGWSLVELWKPPAESEQSTSSESTLKEIEAEESLGSAENSEAGEDAESRAVGVLRMSPGLSPTVHPGPEPWSRTQTVTSPSVTRRTAGPLGKPTALIHIGPPKTGTSYIQRVLMASRDKLLGMNIVYYVPPVEGRQKPAHHFLAHPTRDQAAMTAFQDKLSEAVAKGQHVIVSSEALSLVSPKLISSLKSLFSKFNIKVVLTYRPFLGRTWSAYKQHLSTHNPREIGVSFAEYYGKASRSGTDGAGLCGYAASNYIQGFGRDSVFILDFLGAQKDGDIVNMLLSAVDLPTFEEPLERVHVVPGLTSDQAVYFQMWHLFGKYMFEHHHCILEMPPRQMLAYKVDAMVKHHTMPKKCLDMEPMKKYALKMDANFRAAFGDRMLHFRPDLSDNETTHFEICELDHQIVRMDWNDLFEKHAEALLSNSCQKQ